MKKKDRQPTRAELQRDELAAMLCDYARALWKAHTRDPQVAKDLEALGVDLKFVEGLAGGAASSEAKRRKKGGR